MAPLQSRNIVDLIAELDNRVDQLQSALARGPILPSYASTTLPANPPTGLEVLVTDYGLRAWWNGSAWIYPPQRIQTQIVGAGGAPNVTLSPIPSVFTNLQLEWRAHCTSGGVSDLLMQVDAVTSSSYVWAKMEAVAATQSNFHGNTAATWMKIGAVGGTTAGYFSSGSLSIAGWSSSTGYLTISGTSTLFDSNTSDYIGTYGGLYAAVPPHGSLKIFPAAGTLAAGTQCTLYGLT